ncbi:MAG: metal ABC transporter substrate-binding protein [Lachnospiraceae bacterium]
MKKMNDKKIWAGLLLLSALLLSLSGCGVSGHGTSGGEDRLADTETDSRLRVVTTLFPYYDFARQIGGEEIRLSMVIPAGMDSHSFEPTPADIKTIEEADVLICNGGEMEQWLNQVLDALDTKELTVITMMDYVEDVLEETHGEEDHGEGTHGEEDHEEAGEDHGDHDHEYDEHIWTSPIHAQRFAQVIGETLEAEDPDNGALYRERSQAYQEELLQIRQGFEQIVKEKQRNTIVVGDKFPFRYLAEDYGFDYLAAFSGCSSDTEPSARTIATMIEEVKHQEIPVVYYLELSSHRVAELIGEETGAVPMLLHSCHNVTRKEFDAGVTYVELMRTNIENLRKGLVE